MIDLDDISMKPEWMRPPSWRWLVAERFLANPTLDPSSVESDPILLETVKYMRFEKSHHGVPGKLSGKYPHMSAAASFYFDSIQEGWRWMLEAYLMTDLSDAQVAARFKLPIDAAVVNRYRKVFFDLDSYRHSLPAVSANLLATSRAKVDSTGVSDFTWKVFAHVWGAEAFENFFLPSRAPKNREHVRWMRENNAARLDAFSFHTTSAMRTVYNEKAIALLDTARNYWDIDEEAGGELKAESTRAFLDTVSTHIHMKILSAPARESEVDESGLESLDTLGEQTT